MRVMYLGYNRKLCTTCRSRKLQYESPALRQRRADHRPDEVSAITSSYYYYGRYRPLI